MAPLRDVDMLQSTPKSTTAKASDDKCHNVETQYLNSLYQGPLLQTWFNFDPSMDK